MKKFTKTLSIVLLVAMCVSMFTVSSFAAHTCKDHPGEAVHHAAVPAIGSPPVRADTGSVGGGAGGSGAGPGFAGNGGCG